MTTFTANFPSKFLSFRTFLHFYSSIPGGMWKITFHFTVRKKSRFPNADSEPWARAASSGVRATSVLASAFPSGMFLFLSGRCRGHQWGFSIFTLLGYNLIPPLEELQTAIFPSSLLPLSSPCYLNTFYIKMSINVPGWHQSIASSTFYTDHNLREGITMLPAYACTSHLHPLPHSHILATNLCKTVASEHLTNHIRLLHR